MKSNDVKHVEALKKLRSVAGLLNDFEIEAIDFALSQIEELSYIHKHKTAVVGALAVLEAARPLVMHLELMRDAMADERLEIPR